MAAHSRPRRTRASTRGTSARTHAHARTHTGALAGPNTHQPSPLALDTPGPDPGPGPRPARGRLAQTHSCRVRRQPSMARLPDLSWPAVPHDPTPSRCDGPRQPGLRIGPTRLAAVARRLRAALTGPGSYNLAPGLNGGLGLSSLAAAQVSYSGWVPRPWRPRRAPRRLSGPLRRPPAVARASGGPAAASWYKISPWCGEVDSECAARPMD